jgi:hypothetical protein
MRLVVQARVEPAEDGPGELVEVQRAIRIVGELQMMRAVAGVDEFELAGGRIVNRSLPALQNAGSSLRIFEVFHTRPRSSIIGLCGSEGFSCPHRCSMPQKLDGRAAAGKRVATLRGSSRVGMTTFHASLVTGSTTLMVPWPADTA